MKHIKLSRLSDRQLLRLLGRAEVRFANPELEKVKDYHRDIAKRLHDLLADYQMVISWKMTNEEARAIVPEMREVVRLEDLLKKALEKSGKKIAELARKQ